MNPPQTNASTTPKRIVNDVAGSPPSATSHPAAVTTLTPSIVNNIPMRSPDASQTVPLNEDEELDLIMNDVGKEMKKEDKKPRKRGFALFKKNPKSDVKFSAQPIPKSDVKAAPIVRAQPVAQRPSAPQPATPQPRPQTTKPTPLQTPVTAPVPTPDPRSIPVLAIFMTVIVTGALIGAAIYTYKNG